MLTNINLEHFMFIGAALFLIGIIASKASYRFGVPALLLFLIVGVIFGEDGIGGLHFDSPYLMQFIGMISLTMILFSGGMDTKYVDIKPILVRGSILSTLGVLLTALFTGVFIYWLTNNFMDAIAFSLLESFLLASVMSSTDSATVFAILGSKGLVLKERLKPLLEFESGSNDPMAYMLMIMFIQLIQSEGQGSIWGYIGMFVFQFVFGAVMGIVFGILAVRFINRINVDNDAFYPIMLICISFITFSVTQYLQGNGYLAVYLCGLVIGNSKFVHKYSGKRFLDGVAWLCQGVMFLGLGLLVKPSQLMDVAGIGLLISFFMIIISRSAAVFLCLLPFKKMAKNAKIYTAWVGLRGAVPIIFATYPLTAGLAQAPMIFNIVFFVTLVSLLVQGTSVAKVAEILHLTGKPKFQPKLSEFEISLSEDIKSTMTEITITPTILEKSNKVMDLPLPDKTLVVLIKRENHYFVPKGSAKLEANDVILLISEDEDSLQETYSKLEHHNDPIPQKKRKKWDRFLSRWT
ncbi:MAG: potassium/proton antiporter [Bacteroidales bacterium]|jgi:cell volume regulation protein A|nr:potassium/proton antiporter [Bacteroidales bacterium]